VGDDAEIDLPAIEGIEDLVGGGFAEAEANAGVTRAESGEDGREEVGTSGGACAEADLTGIEPLDLGDGALRIGERGEQSEGARQEDLARGGERSASAIAMKEPSPERLFEPLHGSGERRLGEVRVTCSAGEGPMLGDEREVPKRIEHKEKLSQSSEQSIGWMSREPLRSRARRQ